MFSLVTEKKFEPYYKKNLFMTATPRLYSLDERSKAKNQNISVLSMDEEAVYDKKFFNYSFKQAINDNNLCDYELIIFNITASNLPPAQNGYYDFFDHLKDKEGLENLFKKYGLEKIISFSNKIKNSKKLRNVLQERKSFFNVQHVDGK